MFRQLSRSVFLVVLLSELALVPAVGAEFHMSVSGSDAATATGTAAAPFRTLDHARDLIRGLRDLDGQLAGEITVVVHAGTYRLLEPFVLSPNDSGTATAHVVYRAADGAELDAKYQAWVATLPPDQQAWERTLQENLGGFYLPIHKRQKVEGQSNAWDFVQDDPALPRVLLIGDSVSRGYTQAARKALAGKANVHRAPANCGPTSLGVSKIDVWLGDGKWDVIHFNFGIHDRNTPIVDYEQRLEQLVKRLKRTGAKLVWASTTPIPDLPEKKYSASSIRDRNQAAARVMQKQDVAIDDLFTAITPHVSEMQNSNDVHFNAKGYDFLGGQVAAFIEQLVK